MDEPWTPTRGNKLPQTILRWLLAATFVGAGALHFRATNTYLQIMPPYLPLAWHRPLVLVSGAAEIAGGLGLLVPRLRRAAGWGLILLLVAVFPANVEMARRGLFVSPFLGWLRLPLQAVLIAWVYWCAGLAGNGRQSETGSR